MSNRRFQSVRQAITALLLLTTGAAGLEFWMRGHNRVSTSVICGRTNSDVQNLLQASETTYHDLKPSSTLQIQPRHRTGNSHTFRTNAEGCRGEELAATTDGLFRILILGDDTICAANVAESDTIPTLLQTALQKRTEAKLKVINGGVPGYCPLLSLIKYEQVLSDLKPELVILHFDMSDVADDQAYRSHLISADGSSVCRHPVFRLKAEKPNPFMPYVKKSATISWLFCEARQRSPEMIAGANDVLRKDYFDWISDDPPDLRLQIRHALKPVKELRDRVTENGGKFLVTTSPVLWQVAAADAAPELSKMCGIHDMTPFSSRFPTEVLQAYCDQEKIRFLDTSEAFRSAEDANALFDSTTPILSKAGLRIYAREIALYLMNSPPSQWE